MTTRQRFVQQFQLLNCQMSGLSGFPQERELQRNFREVIDGSDPSANWHLQVTSPVAGELD